MKIEADCYCGALGYEVTGDAIFKSVSVASAKTRRAGIRTS